ncbi:MAG TPA: alpha/beta hydrolase-fold protein [Polyangia bacterium]|jgi:enterochelin esterase-like enzyme
MTRWFGAGTLALCALVGAGCGSGAVGGAATGTGGSNASGSGGGQVSGGSGGSGNGGATGTGSGGSVAPTDGGGTIDTGATETAPPPAGDGGYTSSAGDPGTDGDGMRTINCPCKTAPEFNNSSVPHGTNFSFTMAPGTIYPKAITRKVGVYVPMQYKMGTPAAVMVFQDGTDFYGFDSDVPKVLDNLISKGSVPPIVGVFVGNGGGDSVGSERGLEYDTVSGLYAQYIDTEVLPRVEMETATRMPNQKVTFTHDPEGRGTMGGSSGGAASFSMAWWHPDLFRRVITFSGTYVDQVPSSSPFPHGCWSYHDYDPYVAAGPNGQIVAHCESATDFAKGSSNPGTCDKPLTEATCTAAPGCQWNTVNNKPIRIWHESGSQDLQAGDGPSSHRDFDLANQRMAASFAKRGYHYHYDHAINAGHVDGGAWHQILPEGLTWLWRGYKASGM